MANLAGAVSGLLLLALGIPTEPRPPALVLLHANVLDGDFVTPRMNQAVVVRDGRIVSVGPGDPGAEGARLDLGGAWLLPGLVDAHVHVDSIASGRRMLALGVTTGRSMFTMNFADAGLEALHERGDEDVPTILAAGYPVVARPARFEPDPTSLLLHHPELDRLRRDERVGAEGAREMVQANARHRAEWIKVFANERAGVLATDPATRNLSDEELTAAVAEARRLGLPAAAHAYSDDGVAASVRAGVKTVEHGALVTEPTLRLMKEHDVCFTPTLSGFYAEVQPRSSPTAEEQGLQPRVRMLLEHLQKALATARRLGVKVIAGTDTGYSEGEPTLLDEIEHLAQNGLTSAEALRTATTTAAECLGLSARKGAVKAGLEADLVAFRLDPRDDLRALRSPVLVVNGGRVFLDRLGQ